MAIRITFNRFNYAFIVKTLTALFASLFLWGCSEFFEDDSFSLRKTPYTGEEIRIDGYYWHYMSSGGWYRIIIPYSNGIVINLIAVDSLAELENKIISNTFKANFKQNWGLFVVDSSEIKIENIVGVGGLHKIAYTYYGTILNDSTLHFYRRKESYASVAEATDDTFHLKEFSPKPDSINSFIP